MRKTRYTTRLVLSSLALAASTALSAQPAMQPPCCRVASIDVSTGVVTARPIDTGSAFKFRFDSGVLPSSLKVDQLIWARGGKVSLNGTQNCCTIVPGATKTRGLLDIMAPRSHERSYSAESTSHVRECDEVALRSSPRGGQKCNPRSTMISSGKNPDGSDATYSWTCVCS
jgi:hypothetical protein